MKITKEFAPITIVIETSEEYQKLQEYLGTAMKYYMDADRRWSNSGPVSHDRIKMEEIHNFKKKLGMQ